MTYYDEIAEGYNELHGQEQERKAIAIEAYLKEHFEISDDIELLDVGCGTCHATLLFPGNKTGIDPAQKLLNQCHESIKTVHGRAEELPFEDNQFDLVISLTAVHNFDDIEKGLTEMKRVGKAIFAITVLKKSENRDKIKGLLEKLFKVEAVLDDVTDDIYILKKDGDNLQP
jgi:ubiquinone/menaquinone biosynthesis C-methylase UbiE